MDYRTSINVEVKAEFTMPVIALKKTKIQNLTIGQLAERTGLSVSAIRFYESRGLVSPGRNAGGQRRFARADLRRLSFVMVLQQLGYTIAEIRSCLEDLPEGRTPTKRDWTRISRAMRTDLDRRIETMIRLRDRLDGCIGCGCLSLKSCALYNPQDRAETLGTGAQFVLGDNPYMEDPEAKASADTPTKATATQRPQAPQ